MKALVIGFGVSGRAAAALLLEKRFSVTAADRRFDALQKDPQVAPFIAKGMELCSDHETLTLAAPFSIAVLSPGIQPTHPLVRQLTLQGVELVSEIELALRYLSNDLIIAVTGSNGKTTTVLLAAHILNASGKKAKPLGNIGSALSDYALKADDGEILVIELSSFQLQLLSTRPFFHAALILNITPNHLNWHRSMQEYANAKLRLKDCLKPNGTLFVSKQVKSAYHVGTAFDEGEKEEEQGIHLGMAESENIQAARALCSFCHVPKRAFDFALKSFRKPPHRIEWVAEIDGVAYYNDSKASNIDAVLHAVALLGGPIILIAGGVDKGSSYTPWIEAFQRKVKKIVVYGEAAEKMERELDCHFPMERVSLLQDAFQIAILAAKPRDTVLFSPGCSSYDQFESFEQRGDMFKKMVRGCC